MSLINRFSRLQQPTAKPLRHDLNRRRTLKRKHLLLKEYGIRMLTVCYFGFGAFAINKYFLNPPEYASKEEEEKSHSKFGLSDMATRLQGYIVAFRESTDNKSEIKKINVPKQQDPQSSKKND